MKKEFKILHIDPMGQGVDKSGDEITFIKKTLPEEIVEAQVFKKKQKIQFAKLLKIKSPSPIRTTADCPHFEDCNGCDFQHTNYQNELTFKELALKRHLIKYPPMKINLHEAPRRFHYRNRVQLHYDIHKLKLGMLDSEFNIVEVPNCIIAKEDVTKKIKELYTNNNWLNLATKSSEKKGHIEVYSHNDQVKVSLNAAYAEGGFTQVYPEMNTKLIQWVLDKTQSLIKKEEIVYDLFGGNGNISRDFTQKTLVVDVYKKTPEKTAHQSFFSLNLYGKDALNELKKMQNKFGNPDWLIIDPPRSGLKNIKEFLDLFAPKGFIYIACDPTSFARDCLGILDQYQLNEIELFDLFPATQHFETVGIFTKR